MSIHAHIYSLEEKRLQLKQRIAEESQHPSPDFNLIRNLKKQNLALKEEMQRYYTLMKRETSNAS